MGEQIRGVAPAEAGWSQLRNRMMGRLGHQPLRAPVIGSRAPPGCRFLLTRRRDVLKITSRRAFAGAHWILGWLPPWLSCFHAHIRSQSQRRMRILYVTEGVGQAQSEPVMLMFKIQISYCSNVVLRAAGIAQRALLSHPISTSVWLAKAR